MTEPPKKGDRVNVASYGTGKIHHLIYNDEGEVLECVVHLDTGKWLTVDGIMCFSKVTVH